MEKGASGEPMRSKVPIHETVTNSLLLIVPGMIWGCSFFFIDVGLRAVGPNGVSFLRILIGFATLSLFPRARRHVPRAAFGKIALLSILWIAFPLSMFPFAEKHVSSAVTGMLNATTPIFAAIVAAFLAKRVPELGVIVGILVGVSGATLVALSTVNGGSSSVEGIALILAATISYGFALNVARPLQQSYGALPVIWRALGLAVLLTAPLGMPATLVAHWAIGPVCALVALGALGTGVAFVLLTTAIGRVGATRASATTFLMPPVALLAGVVWNGEHVAPLSILGSAVCLLGAWFLQPRRDRKLDKPAALLEEGFADT